MMVEQGIAAVAHGFGEVALLGAERCVEQQAAHADDGVHRGADLVAHHRQEGALGLGGGFGGPLGLAQFLLGPHTLGDVAIQADGKVAIPHFGRRSVVLDDVLFPVGSNPREDSRKGLSFHD